MHVVQTHTDRRHTCQACGQYRALYVTRRGRVKAATDHPLCQRCFQAELDRTCARDLQPRRFGLSEHWEHWRAA